MIHVYEYLALLPRCYKLNSKNITNHYAKQHIYGMNIQHIYRKKNNETLNLKFVHLFIYFLVFYILGLLFY